VRRHPHQRLLNDALSRPGDRQHLAAWARLTEEAARTAPQFPLHPGDLLCLVNYRVFHGREPHTGYDRILHKLWAWSNMAFGLPCPSDLVPARRQHPQPRRSSNPIKDQRRVPAVSRPYPNYLHTRGMS
jgi:Taurine catabolism dioxygenase TauD, TfdA family